MFTRSNILVCLLGLVIGILGTALVVVLMQPKTQPTGPTPTPNPALKDATPTPVPVAFTGDKDKKEEKKEAAKLTPLPTKYVTVLADGWGRGNDTKLEVVGLSFAPHKNTKAKKDGDVHTLVGHRLYLRGGTGKDVESTVEGHINWGTNALVPEATPIFMTKAPAAGYDATKAVVILTDGWGGWKDCSFNIPSGMKLEIKDDVPGVTKDGTTTVKDYRLYIRPWSDGDGTTIMLRKDTSTPFLKACTLFIPPQATVFMKKLP